MLNHEEFDRLARLLNNLHLCTGIKFALMDERGQEVYTSSERTSFCSAIVNEGGLGKCLACDRQMVEFVMRTHQPRRYQCHAGLYEAAMPVMDEDQVVAIILFGQMLDDSPREEQWTRIRQQCAWHPDMDTLHQAFFQLRQISEQQMVACMEISRTCVREVRMHGLANSDHHDDALRLKLYIDAHYADDLNTDRLSEALHMGKTNLYAVCQKRFRMTPMQMVTHARIEAAKELLLATRESIKFISQTVGFSDQSYFAKVFRKQTGSTPQEYRTLQHHEV